MEYPEKSLKFDPATGDVAVRTRFPEGGAFSHMAWMVASVTAGARNASSADVADWVHIPAHVLADLTHGEE